MDKKQLIKLMDETDDLEALNATIKGIIKHKEELASLPQDKLNNVQKIWLLAFEASEARLAKMGSEQTEQSKEEFSRSMFILDEAIK